MVRDVANAQSLNGYAYAENNPIAFDEPTGACIPPECRTTGLWFSGHPIACFVPVEARRDAVPAATLPARVGDHLAIVGLPCARRRVETKR